MKNKWYCHVNLKPLGPFSLEEVRAKIHQGEVGPQDLICDESNSWRPAMEWALFEFQLFPAGQGLTPDSAMVENVREWVLLVNSGNGMKPLQEGPYSLGELRESLRLGRISPQQYIWKTGLSGWCQVKDRPEFAVSSMRPLDPSLV